MTTMKQDLYFKIQGEWLTERVRNLWVEGEGSKAIKILVEGLPGMTESQAVDVLCGRKRLTGFSPTVSLVDDASNFDDRGILLPKSIAHVLKEKDEALRKEKSEHAKTVAAVIEHGRMESPQEMARRKYGLTYGAESIEDARKRNSSKPIASRDWNTFNCGWMSPDGKFYGCGYMGHRDLASELMPGGEPALEKGGWIKYQKHAWIMPWRFFEGGGKVSQAQLDVLFDWSQEKKCEMPTWLETS